MFYFISCPSYICVFVSFTSCGTNFCLETTGKAELKLLCCSADRLLKRNLSGLINTLKNSKQQTEETEQQPPHQGRDLYKRDLFLVNCVILVV